MPERETDWDTVMEMRAEMERDAQEPARDALPEPSGGYSEEPPF